MNYLVLDLEMTGDDPSWHEIIQIGACLFDSEWNELGRYLQNVYPENEESFSMPSYKVHGLSLEDLDDAPMLHDVLPEFENWIIKTAAKGARVQDWQREGYLKGIQIVGQGIANDINFLRTAYRNIHLNWNFSYKSLDLQNLSFFLFEILRHNGQQTPRSLSLQSVAQFFGRERESDIHNALEDAALTGFCIKSVLDYAKRLKLS